ncbi:glycosyltransferase family 2 protein [Flavobacterium sp. KS-LB2]|uniref:glycosyltransferase family 2 protein n=1 Tax=Flavobacterium sp. KS-LB2 TaxID=3120525 RepID=UPI0030D3BC82
MKESFLISVIIPAYNVEEYISECINSLCSKKTEAIEIIIVDDGSKDNTLNIIKTLEKNNSNITILTQSNSGVSAARNHGLSIAKGQYVYFMDSDDWVEQDFFNEIVTVCIKIKPDCIIFGYKKRNASGNFISTKNPMFSGEINSQKDKITLAKLFSNECGLAVWDKIIKKSILIENNIKFQEMRNAEDFVFSLDALNHSEKIYVLNKVLYNYRIQISGKRSDNYELVKNQIIAFKKFNDYFDFFKNQSLEVESFGKKIFIKWFGFVAPLNIVNFNRLNFTERKVLLKEQQNDFLVSQLLKKFSFHNLNRVNKILLLILKLRSTTLLYLTGFILSKSRKIYFK